MSCERCIDLCVEFQIRSPTDLRKAISVADANLKDSTIVEVPKYPPNGAAEGSFASVLAGSAWDDIFAYSFKCTRCGEIFVLSAETFHGSGGTWRPKNKAALRV